MSNKLKTYPIESHCLLCDKGEVDLMRGVYCKVTGEKPDFIKTCSIATFILKLDDEILDVNAKFIKLSDTKFYLIIYLIVFFGAGIIGVVGSFFLWDYINTINFRYEQEKAYALVAPIFFFFFGWVLIVLAISQLNGFRNEHQIVVNKKRRLDTIMSLYGLAYDLDLNIKDSIFSYHVPEVKIKNFKIFRVPKK